MAGFQVFRFESPQKIMEFSPRIWFITPMSGIHIHHRKILLLCLFLIFFALPATRFCSAEPIKQVISTSPSWKKFTNPDGTGLYHEILARIFTPHGIQVVHQYTNAKRGLFLVKNALADIYTCKADITDHPDLMLARTPMYEGKIYALFRTDRIKNWRGISSLAHQRVVWRWGHYKKSEFPVDIIVEEADSGEDALCQIDLGRADFYVDDLNLIKEAMTIARGSTDRKGYVIEPVGKRTYHPAFKNSSRGKFLMELYESGMKKLHRSGELQAVFKKWDLPYPEGNLP